MSVDIEITWEVMKGIWIVSLEGRLDLTKSDTFEKNVTKKIEEEPRNLIVNLSKISYMSSSGIRAMLAIHRLLDSYGKSMCLCEVPPVVKKVIEVVEISQIFTVFDQEEEALASFQS